MSKKNKKPSVTCPTCGIENPIHSAFCKGCSGRLYKDGAGPDSAEDHGKVSRIRAVRNFVSSIILLVLVAGGGLALWPIPPTDIPTTTSRSSVVNAYLDRVEAVRRTGRGLADIKLSQASVNAFLGRHAEPDQRKLFGATLSDDRILMQASEPIGPLTVSSRLELQAEEGTSTYVPVALTVGQLPLPPALTPYWVERMIGVFELDVKLETLKALQVRHVFKNGLVVGTDSSR